MLTFTQDDRPDGTEMTDPVLTDPVLTETLLTETVQTETVLTETRPTGALKPKRMLRRLPDYRAGRSSQLVMREQGLDSVIALAANEMSDGPLPSVEAVIAGHYREANRYPEVRSATLIDAIAHFHSIPSDRVAVGPGSAGLMWQFSEAFLDDRSAVVAPTPSFEGYPLIAAMAGATYRPVPLRHWTVDVDGLIDAATTDADVVFVAEPNNPTGTAIGANGLRRLIEHTRDRCFLVVDEAYVEFNDHPDAVDAIELAADEPHVLVFRTFSKAHGLAGLRVGYAVGDPEVCTYLNRVAPPFSVNALAQHAAAASLAARHELQARIRTVATERVRVIDRLRALGLAVADSYANFVFIPTERSDGLAVELEAAGVVTRPVDGAGLRVTIGNDTENDRFLDAMAIAVTSESEQQ